jgi:hypothetical protein
LKHHSSSSGESVKQWTYDLVKDLADNLSSFIPEDEKANIIKSTPTIRREFDSEAKALEES